ncbi:hypothetical protein KY319_04090 [Candidatus Woesearchaeota archaeon]|nr:hypothetical protein [Candidatus Woesearchaeota archaeon]
MADEELVKKFVELQSQTEQFLREEKIKDAKQKYLEVVDTYHQIEKSQLEQYHKELAYSQVTTLFKKVNQTKRKLKIPYHLIIAGILVIAMSVLVFLKPSIVGLAGLENTVRQPVNITFTETKLHQMTLRDKPITLQASGTYEGTVKLYYKQGDKFELVFDSAKGNDGKFIDSCEETCELNAPSNVIDLFAQVEKGSKLTLTEIAYKIERKGNTAPAWKATSRTLKAKANQASTYNLDEYFTDADEDPLVYLSTTAEGLDVTVQNNQLSITPKTTGNKNIVLIASDLIAVTRIPVTIEVS